MDGTTESDISGATSGEYVLVAADEGNKVKVEVWFRDDADNREVLMSAAYPSGTDAVESNVAPAFTDTLLTRSVAENTAADIAIGSAVAATDGNGDTLAYTLEGTDKDAFAIDDASGQIKTKAALDFEAKPGYAVTVKADDGNGGTDTVAVTINVTDVNEPPSVSATPGSTESLDVGWSAPVNAGRPAIASYDLRYRVGDSGAWSNGPQDQTGASAAIAGLEPDTGYQVQVRATNADGDSGWSNPGTGSTSSTSNNAATGPPTVSGTAEVGETLTAPTTDIPDVDGLTNVNYAYQWVRVRSGTDSDIDGATFKTYTLGDDDEGAAIKVTVSFNDDAGNLEELTSTWSR